VRSKEAFRLDSIDAARGLVRAYPFATIVTRSLCATHMPCLLDEPAKSLTIVGHVASADPVSRELDGPLLLIFHGPHGYVSASWYGDDTIPTWNHVTPGGDGARDGRQGRRVPAAPGLVACGGEAVAGQAGGRASARARRPRRSGPYANGPLAAAMRGQAI
jgi:Putative FMN-binding domain